MSGWKVAKTTKVDLEERKKKNAASKIEHERQAKIKEYRKNKKKQLLEQQEKGKQGEFKGFKKTPTKGTKGTKNKPKKQKKLIKKCEKAEKDGCDDIQCKDSHTPCKLGLDCTKKVCNLIHKPKILEIPQTKEETLIYIRLIHLVRENALTNATKPAVGRFTFEKLASRFNKKQDPELFVNLRCDWTWLKYAQEMEKEHSLPEGSLSSSEIKESDLAQFYEFFINDLKEHFYTHTKNYELEKVVTEGEEEEEENQVTEFDNNKIDAVLKEAVGKTTTEIINDFPVFNQEKKLAQEWRCWKYIFQARVLQGILDLEETEAILLLDNLIGLVEKGTKENDVVFNGKKFTVDPGLLSLAEVECSKEITGAWKLFNKGKKPTEVVKQINESLGAEPNVVGFSSFPTLMFQVKNHMDVFKTFDINNKQKPSIEDHIKAIKETYQKTSWSFSLAEFLNKKEGDFLIYESIAEAKNYGPIYAECKQKIQELWK
eukprot:TRINITY_DN1079_c0_g1_i1.p1 TRINITY_DN1079_c0_g1~~TRINITY_DN1079_c0_g1_i1.p1  ORF type:complete len:486 (+),score=194.64 TRINITY_DN1079_c0_g1_i1:112-1569(+)